jgi:hypothetical protein
VEEPITSQVKEETASSLKARDVRASTTLGTFARTDWKKKMVVAHMDWLESYQGTTKDERP